MSYLNYIQLSAQHESNKIFHNYLGIITILL